jgi:hypothetical protein
VSNELSNYRDADRQPRLDDPGSFRAPAIGIDAHLGCFTPKRSLFESEGPISEDYGERVSVCAMRSGPGGLLFCGDCAPVDTVRQSATVRLFLHGQATASPLPAPLEKWELELTVRGR